MKQIALDPDAAAELSVYLASLDAYLAGVKAGIEAARQIRLDQIIKAHRGTQDATAPAE